MHNVFFSLINTPGTVCDDLRRWIKEELNFEYNDALGTAFDVREHKLSKCIIRTITPSKFYGIIFQFFNKDDASLFKLVWGEWCLHEDIAKRISTNA